MTEDEELSALIDEVANLRKDLAARIERENEMTEDTKYDEKIVYVGDLGGAFFASKANRRCLIIVDKDATPEEAEDTIKWAREKRDKPTTPEEREQSWRNVAQIIGGGGNRDQIQ